MLNELDDIHILEAMPLLKPSKAAILSRDYSTNGPDKVKVRLPVGFKNTNGDFIQTVWLTPLTGRDEVWGEKLGLDLNLPEWVSRLLTNKVTVDKGSLEEDFADKISVADRDLLIIYLRMLTFGPEIWGVTECPRDKCGSKLDFTFDLTTIQSPLAKKQDNVYSDSIEYQSKEIAFAYREPNGKDQEIISNLVQTEPYRALLELLSRCLIQLDGLSDISTEKLSRLPQDLLLALDKEIAEGMISFDWDIKIVCPECDQSFITTLDIQSFFSEELQFSQRDLWMEVHRLAFYYHWTEDEILALTRCKRKMYLGYIQSDLINRWSGN